jgi:hypothetical protein
VNTVYDYQQQKPQNKPKMEKKNKSVDCGVLFCFIKLKIISESLSRRRIRTGGKEETKWRQQM